MKLPYLKIWDVTPVTIIVAQEGLTPDGERLEAVKFEGLCNYNETTRTVRNPDGQLIQLGAILVTEGDIAPECPVITGTVEVNGRKWNIQSADRPRNPDNTVHHTRLELV